MSSLSSGPRSGTSAGGACYVCVSGARYLRPFHGSWTVSTRELDAVREHALALNEQERAELARDLVASLDGPRDPDLNTAWDIELCRRINEIESGHAALLEPSEVLARARARLAGR